jgi:hypothetical protein
MVGKRTAVVRTKFINFMVYEETKINIMIEMKIAMNKSAYISGKIGS